MKKFILQTVLLLILIGISLYLYKQGPDLNVPFLPKQPIYKQLVINDYKLKVEIADTTSQRAAGLGGRQNLASDEGMLFIFPQEGKYPFWMKGLTFPLDFVWIKGDKVVDLLSNIQPPAQGQTDAALPIYTSKENMDKVLEVPAGIIQKLNIKVGDIIKIS